MPLQRLPGVLHRQTSSLALLTFYSDNVIQLNSQPRALNSCIRWQKRIHHCLQFKIYYYYPRQRSRYSDGRPRGGSSSPGRGKIFLFSTRSVLDPPSLLYPMGSGDSPPGSSGRSVKPVTPLQTVKRSTIRGFIHPSHDTSSWHSAYN
jgi:hypothetical protein